MDYQSAAFAFDCREVAKDGVISYSQLRELFFDLLEEDPQMKEQIKDVDVNDLGHLFVEAYPGIKKVVEEIGLKIDEKT